MNKGNPRCLICNGKGGYRDGFGWRKCVCTRMTAEQRRLQQIMNSTGAKNANRQIKLF